jgi:hypothetical protein
MDELKGNENGIAYWEVRFCKYCKNQLCRETAQAKTGLLVGQGAKKDYLSCMTGFSLAIQLGDRSVIREFKKKGVPSIKQ